MRYVTIILTIAIFTLAGLPGTSGQDVYNMGVLPPETNTDSGRDLAGPAEVDLYKKPGEDEELTEAQKALKKVAPELFRTEAVIVVFGAEWCRYCKVQARELRGPSQRYNVLVYDVEDEKGNGKKVSELLEVGGSIPVTFIVEKGIVKKSFEGFTPWAQIKLHAKKAAKNEDQKGDVNIGPLNIHWDLDGVDINWDRERRRR